MNRLGKWNYKFKIGKIMLGLVLTAMLGSLGAVPANADDHRGRGGYRDDDHGRREYRDNDRYEHRGRGHERNRRHMRHNREYRSTVYRERVYVEPPVVYVPPPPPGIGIFFPPLFFRP